MTDYYISILCIAITILFSIFLYLFFYIKKAYCMVVPIIYDMAIQINSLEERIELLGGTSEKR